MPVILSGAAVLVSVMLPLVVFVALKLLTVFRPDKTVPPLELVVSSDAFVILPVWLIELDAVKLTVPVVLIVPESAIIPVLLILTGPPPVTLTPDTVNVAIVLVNATPVAEASVALNVVTVFAPLSVVPVAEVVVKVVIDFKAPNPASVILPAEFSVSVRAPVKVLLKVILLLLTPEVDKVVFAEMVTGLL